MVSLQAPTATIAIPSQSRGVVGLGVTAPRRATCSRMEAPIFVLWLLAFALVVLGVGTVAWRPAVTTRARGDVAVSACDEDAIFAGELIRPERAQDRRSCLPETFLVGRAGLE